jgi:hypothetical protein
MKRIALGLGLLSLAAVSSAQYLRSSSYALLSNAAGVRQDIDEVNWTLSSATGSILTDAIADNTGGYARSSYLAKFGTLKGESFAYLTGNGSASAQAHGRFDTFSSFVGASFYDTITLTGTGVVSLVVTYSLHSVNSDPTERTFAMSELKANTYSTTLGNLNPVKLSHIGTGNETTTQSLLITGVAGNTFDLSLELANLSSVHFPTGFTGDERANSDASHTALLTIAATSGSYSAASGHAYTPVPEPATMLALGVGSLACLSRRRRKTA